MDVQVCYSPLKIHTVTYICIRIYFIFYFPISYGEISLTSRETGIATYMNFAQWKRKQLNQKLSKLIFSWTFRCKRLVSEWIKHLGAFCYEKIHVLYIYFSFFLKYCNLFSGPNLFARFYFHFHVLLLRSKLDDEIFSNFYHGSIYHNIYGKNEFLQKYPF